MPHLRFRAVPAAHVASLSQTLPKELALIMETNEDNFSFELEHTEYFESGQPQKSYPFVEVAWFARSQDIQDASAQLITKQLRKLMPELDVVVVFQEYSKRAYYENGKHF